MKTSRLTCFPGGRDDFGSFFVHVLATRAKLDMAQQGQGGAQPPQRARGSEGGYFEPATVQGGTNRPYTPLSSGAALQQFAAGSAALAPTAAAHFALSGGDLGHGYGAIGFPQGGGFAASTGQAPDHLVYQLAQAMQQQRWGGDDGAPITGGGGAAPVTTPAAADDRVRVARAWHRNDRIDLRRRRGKRAQQHGNLLVLEMLRHLIQTKVFSQNWLPRIVPLAFSVLRPLEAPNALLTSGSKKCQWHFFATLGCS